MLRLAWLLALVLPAFSVVAQSRPDSASGLPSRMQTIQIAVGGAAGALVGYGVGRGVGYGMSGGPSHATVVWSVLVATTGAVVLMGSAGTETAGRMVGLPGSRKGATRGALLGLIPGTMLLFRLEGKPVAIAAACAAVGASAALGYTGQLSPGRHRLELRPYGAGARLSVDF